MKQNQLEIFLKQTKAIEIYSQIKKNQLEIFLKTNKSNEKIR